MNASELIEDIQYELQDPEGDEHTVSSLLRPLNNALRWVSGRSRSITRGVFLQAESDTYQYGLPGDLLHIYGVKVQNRLLATGAEEGYPPYIPLTRADLKSVDLEGANFSGLPLFYTIGDRAAIEKAEAAPIADHTSYNNRFILYRGDLQLPIEIGDDIFNLSDDLARSTVIATYDTGYPGTIQVEHTDFMDGILNYVSVDDEMRIQSPRLQYQSLMVAPAPAWDDAVGDESLHLYISVEHYKVTQELIDDNRDVLEIDLELIESVKYRTMFYATQSEGGLSNTAGQYSVLAMTEFRENIDRVRRRIKEGIRLWGQSSVRATKGYTLGGGARPNNDFNVI